MGGSISDGILFYRQKSGKNLKKGPIGIQICSRDVKSFGNTRKRAMELVLISYQYYTYLGRSVGTIIGPFEASWNFSGKIQFLLRKHIVLLGRSAFECKISFTLWSQMINKR